MRLDELLEHCARVLQRHAQPTRGACSPGRASLTFISVEATRTSGSVQTTMMAVLEVKEPTNAENVLLLMCMDSGWLWLRPHDNLNCLMMLDIFSKRCTS